MIIPILAILVGLALLVWSADKFVGGAAITARHFGMAPLLIGMVIVGFGTSAPELVVSAMAAIDGNPGIALGNAFGSNIGNITLILGVTALMGAIVVQSQILKKEVPLLIGITLLSLALIFDGELTRSDSIAMLVLFGVLISWTIWTGTRSKNDALSDEVVEEYSVDEPLKKSVFWLVTGLVLLIVSSRVLVWGAEEIARALGVNDLIVGLTIVALGTSLPELATSIIAARKGEHDIALGNVLGSNLFNTLAVVGLAGVIAPMQVPSEAFWRDGLIMLGVTLLLWMFCFAPRGKLGQIQRWKGALFVAIFIGYTGYLISTVV